jgi:hypothetical protein
VKSRHEQNRKKWVAEAEEKEQQLKSTKEVSCEDAAA